MNCYITFKLSNGKEWGTISMLRVSQVTEEAI